ncbi:uncharacterized protein BYT42DRAFT_634634 [Radiomyces spectabilis]|uniref:uncharacterized protein n=1 Tax=Radiomyces spectabilis TaxID=64574 RepID=UPI0022201392|nr:uncharacterized protein BYT42DRAFT_634634 [Radiomyces spectabilis]KAI8381400.1 hypothetical protein BYT42DRAFT_634634 [Radiomyces spectabilis]
MFAAINDSIRNVRLVTIDFAGFCTSTDHLRHFFRMNKTVVEIVVDLGHKSDVFTRHQLLKDDQILTNFSGRKACMNRSE